MFVLKDLKWCKNVKNFTCRDVKVEGNALNRMREQTNEQLVMIKETNKSAKKNGDNQKKCFTYINRSSTSYNMCNF